MKKGTYVFGIDIGGTSTQIGLFTMDGTPVQSCRIKTRTTDGGKEILPDISAALKTMMAEQGFVPFAKDLKEQTRPEPEHNAPVKGVVAGAGLAIPGAVLRDREVKPCVNLNGWGGEDVAGQFSALIHMPVKILNDADAAALGEMWKGSAGKYSDFVFVTLGTGVGGGVIVNGKLLVGAHGAAGEIGHMKLYETPLEEPDHCGYGEKADAEQYSSATGLVRLAAKYGFKGSAKEVMDAAQAGTDRGAVQAVREYADHLGRLLASVSCVTDPEAILIGGGVSEAGEALLEMIIPAFRKYAFPASEDTLIGIAELESDAGMYGAAKYIIDALKRMS